MTEAIEYRTEDKSGWAPGPWQSEPDKVQFVDEDTGLDCLIVRGPSGALCGYVAVTEGHPYYGVDYSGYAKDMCLCPAEHENFSPDCLACPEDVLHVHGGITYSAFCQEGPEDAVICHIPRPGQPDKVWWLGFDCAHSGDLDPAFLHYYHKPYGTYRDVDYVRAECAGLAAQLAAMQQP